MESDAQTTSVQLKSAAKPSTVIGLITMHADCRITNKLIKMEILKIPLHVHLGVINENPSSGQGVVNILKHLSKYVPDGKEERHGNVICHGDQLSVERMIESRICMALS